MAMEVEVEVTITMAWWWRPYVWLLVHTAVLSGRQPDMDKLKGMCSRAMRVKVAPK